MQATWAGGYSAELPYLPTYISAQAPAEMAMACALAGVRCDLPREALTLLDLGCGRGMGVLSLAAANPGWTAIGIDYMPAHVAEARGIAAEAGLDNARFHEADIAALDEAAAARLLPELDVVTLHGVWTWVADPVREGILRVIRSRLKPGGLVLVTYNALPGWAGDLALRRLLRDLVGSLGGPRDRRMAQALDIARGLHLAGAASLERSFFMRRLIDVPPNAREAFIRYAMHEFLPEHWRPAFPQDVAGALAEAKLDFVGPAFLAFHFPELLLNPAQREAVASLPPGLQPEFQRDLFTCPTLRQDVFVRGRRPAEVAGAVLGTTLALRRLPEDRRVRLDTPNGAAELPAPVINAALEALARRPHGIGELLALPALARTTAGELLTMLVGSHIAAPVWRDAPTPAMRDRAQRYNRVLLQQLGADAIAAGGELAAAVPMLGAGLAMKPVELATLLALHEAATEGRAEPDAAAIARGMLVAETNAETLAWTEAAVTVALTERLPAWRGLGLL